MLFKPHSPFHSAGKNVFTKLNNFFPEYIFYLYTLPGYPYFCFFLKERKIDTTDTPARVVFSILTGPVYRLKNVEFNVTGAPPDKEPELPALKKLRLEPGLPGKALPIIQARTAIRNSLKNQGFPLVRVEEPKVTVDHRDQSLSVTYSIDTGPLAAFGETEIVGADSVEPSFIRKLLPWKQGDTFQADLLATARINLIETGLFNVVRFDTDERIDADGRLPLTLNISERKHRTLKLTAGYTTDEGFLGKTEWERRNLFHRGNP